MRKAKEWTLDTIITKYSSFFIQFGLNELHIRKSYENWNKGESQNIKDFLWFLFQSLLYNVENNSSSEVDKYSKQRIIYLQMVDFKRRFEKKKANEILQLFFETDIKLNFTRSNISLKAMIVSGCCCPYCDSLNQKTFTCEEVLNKKYLGSINCTNERGCNCCYAFVSQRDEKGRLILKCEG